MWSHYEYSGTICNDENDTIENNFIIVMFTCYCHMLQCQLELYNLVHFGPRSNGDHDLTHIP